MMNKPILIGYSGKAGSGKTYFANKAYSYLKKTFPELKIKRMSLAEDVKRIAIKEFGWDGNKDKKGRDLLIGIGNDVGRRYKEHIWISKFVKKVYHKTSKDYIGDYDLIIVDDVRYFNESCFFDLKFLIKKPFIKRFYDLFKKISWSKSERCNILGGDNLKVIYNKYDKKTINKHLGYVHSVISNVCSQ